MFSPDAADGGKVVPDGDTIRHPRHWGPQALILGHWAEPITGGHPAPFVLPSAGIWPALLRIQEKMDPSVYREQHLVRQWHR